MEDFCYFLKEIMKEIYAWNKKNSNQLCCSQEEEEFVLSQVLLHLQHTNQWQEQMERAQPPEWQILRCCVCEM